MRDGGAAGLGRARALFDAGVRLCSQQPTVTGSAAAVGVADSRLVLGGSGGSGGVSAPLVQLLQAWACTELNEGALERARALIQRALAADPRHAACLFPFCLLPSGPCDVPRATVTSSRNRGRSFRVTHCDEALPHILAVQARRLLDVQREVQDDL